MYAFSTFFTPCLENLHLPIWLQHDLLGFGEIIACNTNKKVNESENLIKNRIFYDIEKTAYVFCQTTINTDFRTIPLGSKQEFIKITI